jgi:hypothetical protein
LPTPPDAITGIETVVAIHARDEQLAGSEICAAPAPLERIEAFRRASTVAEHAPPGARTLRIDRDHDRLIAESSGDIGDQLRRPNRGRVDRDLVGTGEQQVLGIADRAYPPADGQRCEHLIRRARDDIDEGRSTFRGGRNIEEADLVGALLIVCGGLLDRVAGIAQLQEVDALHDAAVFDVETRDDAPRERHGCSPCETAAASATVNRLS